MQDSMTRDFVSSEGSGAFRVCVRTPEFGKPKGRTADPSASPDFLSRVAATVDCMWFSLGRTT
jgi:hypothetical protein